MEIRISVRSLVEFILRSGDIDNRRTSSPDAMQEGGRIHRMIQKRMGADYHAEVGLKYRYSMERYDIIVEGRADGIIIEEQRNVETKPESPEVQDSVSVTIDEIKGTYHDLVKMKQAVPVHLAQAKCYAYIYAVQNNLKSIRVRMTYCQLDMTEMSDLSGAGIRYFHSEYTLEELQEWFDGVMKQYKKWADYSFEWQEIRQGSIKS
ncbi:MAG: ATP-dependent DNA helicase, partial [Lachnospiraceae bacterium]|nr:ATP-dependent DNA helicase [Lachnospiraceae bacterium]